MKRQIPVRWTFAPKPEPPQMMTLRNGQQIVRGVVHELRPEGYPRTTRIWCYGCKEYFKSWHEVLWRHGLCKTKPKVRK